MRSFWLSAERSWNPFSPQLFGIASASLSRWLLQQALLNYIKSGSIHGTVLSLQMHVPVDFRNDSLNQSFFPLKSIAWKQGSESFPEIYPQTEPQTDSPILCRPPPQFHPPLPLLYFSKSPHNSSGKGNSFSTEAVALNMTPHPLPILTAVLALTSKEYFRQRLEERFEGEKRKTGLKWKAEQKRCLQNLALRMLLEWEQSRPRP